MIFHDINLKMRPLTAYWQEKAITLADNEGLAVKVQDKGRINGRAVLLCNGVSFVLDDTKTAYIPRESLTKANVFELVANGQHYVTENLYITAEPTEYEGDRLVAEREFYAAVFERFESELTELKAQNILLTQRVADLENGKFSLLKFGGKEE